MRHLKFFLVVIYLILVVVSTNAKIRITMKPVEPIAFGRLFYYAEYTLKAQNTIDIYVDLENTKNNINFGFTIIQVHSFLDNVTMKVHRENEYPIFGRHFGVNIFENMRLTVKNPKYRTNIKIAVAAIIYSKNSPVPGGCSQEGNGNTMLNVTLKNINQMIQTDVQLAGSIQSLNNSNSEECKNLFNSYKFYYKYFQQGDLSPETFFRVIKEMIEVTSIEAKGSLAPKHLNGPSNRRNFAKIAGTGVVYNAIVYDSYGGVAAYVPVVTYSCHPEWAGNDCYLIPYTVGWVISALFLIITGLTRVFVVMENHSRELCYNLLGIGVFTAFYLCAILSGHVPVAGSVVVFVAFLFALLLSAVLCIHYKITYIALDITSKLILGWILAIIIVYLLNDNSNFTQDWVYWTSFIVIIFFTMLCLLPIGTYLDDTNNYLKIIPTIVHVIVGGNAFLLGVQILMRSNMLMILFTHTNRIMDNNFKSANGIAKPTAEDLCIFISMPVLFIMGVYCQLKEFIKLSIVNTKTVSSSNLDQSMPRRMKVQRRWGNGSDSVFDSPSTTANEKSENIFDYFKRKKQASYNILE